MGDIGAVPMPGPGDTGQRSLECAAEEVDRSLLSCDIEGEPDAAAADEAEEGTAVDRYISAASADIGNPECRCSFEREDLEPADIAVEEDSTRDCGLAVMHSEYRLYK